ncbi:MAG: substrate-binding domain-containing protein, partial [Halobacteriota archaeon]
MVSKELKIFSILLCCILLSGCIGSSGDTIADEDSLSAEAVLDEQTSKEPLLVYCGAGMRRPMDEIGELFEEEYGIPVNFNYAGANTLLTQMELTGQGDVYIPGATYYFEVAAEKGLIH